MSATTEMWKARFEKLKTFGIGSKQSWETRRRLIYGSVVIGGGIIYAFGQYSDHQADKQKPVPAGYLKSYLEASAVVRPCLERHIRASLEQKEVVSFSLLEKFSSQCVIQSGAVEGTSILNEQLNVLGK